MKQSRPRSGAAMLLFATLNEDTGERAVQLFRLDH